MSLRLLWHLVFLLWYFQQMDIMYQLIVLNIFQESEADIEDFMQQKLEAEEGVGFFFDIVCIWLWF